MTEGEAGEIEPAEIWDGVPAGVPRSRRARTRWRASARRPRPTAATSRSSTCVVRGEERSFKGEGNGPVAAFVDGMRQAGADIRVLDYTEHALSGRRRRPRRGLRRVRHRRRDRVGRRHPREHRDGVAARRGVGRQPRRGHDDPGVGHSRAATRRWSTRRLTRASAASAAAPRENTTLESVSP